MVFRRPEPKKHTVRRGANLLNKQNIIKEMREVEHSNHFLDLLIFLCKIIFCLGLWRVTIRMGLLH